MGGKSTPKVWLLRRSLLTEHCNWSRKVSADGDQRFHFVRSSRWQDLAVRSMTEAHLEMDDGRTLPLISLCHTADRVRTLPASCYRLERGAEGSRAVRSHTLLPPWQSTREMRSHWGSLQWRNTKAKPEQSLRKLRPVYENFFKQYFLNSAEDTCS